MDDPFFVRNLVYGTEDSLLSTTGMVVGLAWSGMPRRVIITSGIILVLVEALSMSFGAFVSEDSFIKASRKEQPTFGRLMKYAGVMFGSYIAAGIIPILPFVLNVPHAWRWSATLPIVALFVLVKTMVSGSTREALVMTGAGAAVLATSIATGSIAKHV